MAAIVTTSIEDPMGVQVTTTAATPSGNLNPHALLLRRDGSIVSRVSVTNGDHLPLSRRCSRHSNRSKRSSLGSGHGGGVTTTTADVMVAMGASPGEKSTVLRS